MKLCMCLLSLVYKIVFTVALGLSTTLWLSGSLTEVHLDKSPPDNGAWLIRWVSDHRSEGCHQNVLLVYLKPEKSKNTTHVLGLSLRLTQKMYQMMQK